MADDWYHIAITPQGTHVHLLNPVQLATMAQEIMRLQPDTGDNDAVALAVGHYVELIRAELGFPADHLHDPGWQSHVAPGEPHPSMMARATYHEELPEALGRERGAQGSTGG